LDRNQFGKRAHSNPYKQAAAQTVLEAIGNKQVCSKGVDENAQSILYIRSNKEEANKDVRCYDVSGEYS